MVETLFVIFSMLWIVLMKVQKMENPWYIRAISMTLLTLMYFLHEGIISIIKIKMPWYNPKYETPHWYIKGPIQID